MSLHVSPHGTTKPWSVRRSGSERALKNFDTKREALTYAKRLGRPIYVHDRDGRVERKID